MKKFKYNPVRPAIVDTLKTICGETHVIFDNENKLRKYSHDQIPEKKYAHMPEVVVMPRNAGEISEIIKLANREYIPVTPRAAGSGLSGGAVPIYGGILLSVERMNEIVEIDAQNHVAGNDLRQAEAVMLPVKILRESGIRVVFNRVPATGVAERHGRHVTEHINAHS